MRWEEGRESANVEDQRGFPIGFRGGSLGCGGLILLLIISWITGVNPLQLLNMVQGNSPSTEVSSPATRQQEPGRPQGSAPADKLGRFASVVLASTEDVWTEIFSRNGKTYEKPKLVLFTQMSESACGLAQAAVGPFYCEQDHKVYLDLSFFQELSRRFGASGDFADAYVIAHEVGHHVQNQLGLFDRVGGSRRNNATSVRIELQADCYAGVWGFHANQKSHMIEPGDFEEGLKAAAAIGDDRLQRMQQGTIQPESFTHGSSSDRASWLRRGLESGDPARCNTF
ncbi:MAG TPA: neutral zinc metallopeptidase [Thermoanaerobaculia bacterium]|jgi:hypothetical protein|nr:neutral zinc metallopeptidase [Thermoanaerobaculia bacterium]